MIVSNFALGSRFYHRASIKKLANVRNLKQMDVPEVTSRQLYGTVKIIKKLYDPEQLSGRYFHRVVIIPKCKEIWYSLHIRY